MQLSEVTLPLTMPPIKISNTFPMADWSKMDDFLVHNYHPGYIMRNRDLFEWQFCGSKNTEHANVVCAFCEERLVGILGYLPLDMFWGKRDAPIRGVWMANWMVDPDFRHGVGVLVMRRLMEMYPVLLGQGAGDMNVPIAKVLGFQIYNQIPRYMIVFDADKTASYVAAQGFCVRDGVDTGEVDAAVRRELTQDYDPDWSLYPGLSFGTVRDAAYLRWRYFDHPVFKYDVMTMGDGTRPAVCVFRVEETKGDIRNRVGRIVEFFYPQTKSGERAGAMVLRAALSEMRARGCVFTDFYGAVECLAPTLNKAGMHLATDDPIATRMSPVELQHQHQNLELWTHPSLSSPPALGDCHITKADGDQDRPN